MKRLSSLIAASFLLASATAVAAPVSVVHAQPQCGDDKKGDDKKGDDKKDDKSGDTKPKAPSSR
jgi:hypothetical protein